MAYRERDNRCEGIYTLQVNSVQIRLLSLIAGMHFDADRTESLKVTWPKWDAAHAEIPMRLRAESVQPRVFYRMDASVDPAKPPFVWPIDVLSSLALGPADIGLLGWFERKVDGTRVRVHVPLTVAQGNGTVTDPTYALTLIPERRLREIFVTLTPSAPGSAPTRARQALDYGYYPAGQPTVIQLDRPPATGVYRLDLECPVLGGGAITASYWLMLEAH